MSIGGLVKQVQRRVGDSRIPTFRYSSHTAGLQMLQASNLPRFGGAGGWRMAGEINATAPSRIRKRALRNSAVVDEHVNVSCYFIP